jgi:hypothetical protein
VSASEGYFLIIILILICSLLTIRRRLFKNSIGRIAFNQPNQHRNNLQKHRLPSLIASTATRFFATSTSGKRRLSADPRQRRRIYSDQPAEFTAAFRALSGIDVMPYRADRDSQRRRLPMMASARDEFQRTLIYDSFLVKDGTHGAEGLRLRLEEE